MQKLIFILLACALGTVPTFAGGPDTPESLAREAAIAQFTRKMQDANYPALFEKAAKEFNVPAQILEGISFAETRWEHLTWPPGETASPENGMPRPFGIMSLWDNDFFGHNLVEAAKLIGKTPDDLKNDPLDNIRGAAAYLRQLYDKTAKPTGTAESDLESWRNAIADYTGIPEVDLKQQHALSVYEWLSRGYNEYGIQMDAVPDLKLEPMRAEVKKIVEEERRKRESRIALLNGGTNSPDVAVPAVEAPKAATQASNVIPKTMVATNSVGIVAQATEKNGWYVAIGLFILGLIGFFLGRFFGRRK